MSLARPAAFFLALGLAAPALGQTTAPDCPDIAAPTLRYEITQRGRVDWSHAPGGLIAFDKRGDDGYFDVYTMKPDGSDETCLTCDHPEIPGLHNGQPAWHPDGRTLVIQVEKGDHKPLRAAGRLAASPGSGMLNDLWVLDTVTGKATQLTDLPNNPDHGVLHPHFSPDGRRLSWSQMYRRANFFKSEGITGYWWPHVADYVVEGGVPRLENDTEYQPGRAGMFENHGFSADGSAVIFQSNMRSDKAAGNTDLYRFTLDTGALLQLTDARFNEHGITSPNGKYIAYMSSLDNDNDGTDWWLMRADGSCKQRLTGFNQPGHAHDQDRKIIAADLTWSPDGTTILGYYFDVDLVNILRGKMQGEGHAWLTFAAPPGG